MSFVAHGFAAWRLARLYQKDSISGDLRDAVQRWLLDMDMDGLPRGRISATSRSWGSREWAHELLGCPWCMTVWTAFLGLLLARYRATRWLVRGLAAAGVAAALEDVYVALEQLER